MRILVKRAYEPAATEDGYRALVDRLWPRGRSKTELALDEWAKTLAPSATLRAWFGHRPERWTIFQRRYEKELSTPEQREALHALLARAGRGPLTLVYGAKDEEHNQAIVLRNRLTAMSKRR
ncbi:MAG TPA: DUF488 family protein [Methylovirgula sp.]|jgi:uncharacterized protein YeaO (DUF488 family)